MSRARGSPDEDPLEPGARARRCRGRRAADPAGLRSGGRRRRHGRVARPGDQAVQHVRVSINETLDLFKQGKDAEALKQSQQGYLDHFEFVEIPLRVADPQFTLDAESKFAEVRQAIRDGRTGDVRDRIIELRGIIDEAERRSVEPRAHRAVARHQPVVPDHLPRGSRAVLLLAVLLGYLEAAKANQFRRPILWGVGLAVLATLATVVAVHFIIESLRSEGM